jgi:hypothetical protein
MTEISELADKKFKADILKMFLQVIMNTLETSKKNRKSFQRNGRYKEKNQRGMG